MVFVRVQPGLYATVYNDQIGHEAAQVGEVLKGADFSRPERLVYELDAVQSYFSKILEKVQALLHKAVKLNGGQYSAKLQLLRSTTFLDKEPGDQTSSEDNIFS